MSQSPYHRIQDPEPIADDGGQLHEQRDVDDIELVFDQALGVEVSAPVLVQLIAINNLCIERARDETYSRFASSWMKV